MSDDSVRVALRSDHPLVVVEAPAGCGKTHQGADYARELADAGGHGRLLILTHTHAACSVFADRTNGASTKVEIRTIDSIIANVAAAYHVGLGIPADTAAWVRQQKNGYAMLAQKVAVLLTRYPMIAAALVRRHPIVICDEHQDSSGDQHVIVMAMLAAGAKLRVFADPMQAIFGSKEVSGCHPAWDWNGLRAKAQVFEELDFPHRWNDGCPALGAWTLEARKSLLSERPISLTNGLPESLDVVFAENVAARHLEFNLSKENRRAVDTFEQRQMSLLILTHHRQTARSFRGFFDRRVPLWEGHTRSALEGLVSAVVAGQGSSAALAAATVKFMGEVGKGFSPTAFGNVFVQEATDGCTTKRRGKPATIQALASCLVDEVSHRGVAKVLTRIAELMTSDAAFADVKLDHRSEFHDAIRLGDYETPEEGLAEITHRRTYSRPRPPAKAISTIHKAKGLECDSVIVMPCDATTFPASREARCLLYVALSRAKKRLMLVVSREKPSPLFQV